MCQVFMAQGYDEDSAYELALKNLLFSKNDIVKYLHKNSGDQQPIVCFDDVRANLSAMSYVSNPVLSQLLLGLFDCARDSVACILTTCPSTKGVMSFLKLEQGYQILIHRSNQRGWRLAKSYLKFEIPSGTMRIKPKFIDEYYYKVPDWVYFRLKDKRKHYKDILFKQLQDRMTKLADKSKDKRLDKEIELVKKLGQTPVN